MYFNILLETFTRICLSPTLLIFSLLHVSKRPERRMLTLQIE